MRTEGRSLAWTSLAATTADAAEGSHAGLTEQAEQIARETDGVSKVGNRLTVGP